MQINVQISNQAALEGFRRAPDIMERHIDAKMGRGAAEIAREAGQRVSKVFSTLWASIRSFRIAALHWRVQAGANYALYVEKGTRPGYLPNPTNLQAWIKARHGIGFGTTKPGSKARAGQQDEIRDRAWALARFIQARGTKPHPFMEPAAKVKTARVYQLVEEGAREAVQEINR